MSSLNCHREFGILVIPLFHDKDIRQGGFEAFKVSPKQPIRFSLELHNVLPNESGHMNWIKFLQEGLDETILRCDRAGR